MLPFFLVSMVVLIICVKPPQIFSHMESQVVYPEFRSSWWYYNAIIGTWMTLFIAVILYSNVYTIITYTIQSWCCLALRHCLTALSPLLVRKISSESIITARLSHFLLSLNEMIRLHSLLTATITFIFWNFFIAPAIYIFFIKSPKGRKSFIEFNCSFKLIQLHCFNIIYAVLGTISVFPRRSFLYEDIWCSAVLNTAYMLFYLLFLDRFGIHLYPVFSPRSKYAFFVMVVTWIFYYSLIQAWNYAIQSETFQFDRVENKV